MQATKVLELVNGNTCCDTCQFVKSQIVAITDSDTSTKMKKSLELDPQVPIKYTPDRALAPYVDGDLPNCNIYPAYDVLLPAKKRCNPYKILGLKFLKIEPTHLSCFQVEHNLQLTMIDGKVFSVIAESSSQACGI